MLIDFRDLAKSYPLDRTTGLLHVGAHTGEEAPIYEELGFTPVYWVEADPEIIPTLESFVNPYGHKVVNRVFSENSGERVTFHVANNNQSSSLLELGTHEQEHPEVHYVREFTAVTDTIDECKEIDANLVNFLNLDVQGAELMVLKGAKETLNHIDFIYAEINEKPLYVGCALVGEIDSWLKQYDFVRVKTEMTRHGWGDGLYVKKYLL